MLSREAIPEGYESILMGDFNFDSSWKAEQKVITDNKWNDVYYQHWPKDQ